MEKFVLKIDAQSPDGLMVKCETDVNVSCSSHMAIAVLVNILNSDKHLKKIFIEAVATCMLEEEVSESISNEEYEENTKDKDITL